MTAPFTCVFQPRNPRRSTLDIYFRESGNVRILRNVISAGAPRFQRLKVWLPPCISVERKAEKHGFMSFRNEGGYGKDNRILHTGEISEKSKVGSGASPRKGDRVPLEHDEVSLERVHLGREALTIGRYQRSTVGLLRSCAFARFRR
jgi:hypothetical protein